jgi:hypothetical protein
MGISAQLRIRVWLFLLALARELLLVIVMRSFAVKIAPTNVGKNASTQPVLMLVWSIATPAAMRGCTVAANNCCDDSEAEIRLKARLRDEDPGFTAEAALLFYQETGNGASQQLIL